ncbi:exoribonuclease-2 [Volucribacter psittacicida]|uniref:Exoribonuclease 2 n=1 Tax=Volucribacter psittacicida TaxID=203482 RepID=A0A4R1G1L4_9PAST|nr:exoribonuclease II [Volucribacter psittacicida]TCK01524.1 exoribonuclease-2 [Volucribacter psittacicida]
MLQNNPLLAQLKQQIQANKTFVEGSVKATDKSYGFLETDKKSYFIPPNAMKKLMHGDKIKAAIETVNDKEQAEPEALIEPMLTRFIAQVHINKDNKMQLKVDHPNIKPLIACHKIKSVNEKLIEGDWVVARLKTHPLRDDRFFFAQIEQFICHHDDHFAPWWVTLARHEQSRYPVNGQAEYPEIEQYSRQDLTALHFVTIDSESTQDMDDALYIEPIQQNGEQIGWKLVVAIADPTAYIPLDSQIEQDAKQSCFTNYLPGFNIPMLPRELADNLCSLVPQQNRHALVCYIHTDLQGNLNAEPEFTCAIVQSKAKLVYDKVSDYLENQPNHWQPEDESTRQQIDWLHQFTLARTQWRQQNALLFKEKPDYSFVLEENGKIKQIKAQYRRIANQIVEECMIIANICAAQYLNEKAKCGIFNTHSGFDKKYLQQVQQFLVSQLANEHNQEELNQRYSAENLTSLSGYCRMRQDIEPLASDYLEYRLRRFLTFAEFKSENAPHFGLGLTGYATWTSPIRKYSDMVNHRLIKACIHQQPCSQPDDSILQRLQEARRQNRLVERDIADWLYSLYFADKVEEQKTYSAEIIDISRGGLRVLLTDNGATVFVPASTIHDNKEEISINNEEIAFYVQDQQRYKLADKIHIKLLEVKPETRSIIGKIVDE